MSSTKPILTKEKHQSATRADPLLLITKTHLSGNPSLGLGLGECNPLEQLDNHRGLPHVVPEVPETTLLVWKTSRMNQKGPMIKDADSRGYTQTNSREIGPRLDDS